MLLNEGSFLRDRALWRSPLAVGGYRFLRRAAARVGFQVVLKTFYSPIPDLEALPAEVWTRRSDMAGIEWDLDAQLRFVTEELRPYVREWTPATAPTGDPAEYHSANGSFPLADAQILYGLVRHVRPRRIVELGSGWSTLVMAQAVRRNREDGAECRLESFDPYPGVARADLDGLDGLHRVRAQDVALSLFEELEEDDVLFIDSTHAVKPGSDVNFAVLEVLPRLRPGVFVHVHDVFLPWEYPREFMDRYGLYWSEQYLLQAHLGGNAGTRALCGVNALLQERPAAMAAMAPGWTAGAGGSFWMRRTAAG